MLRICLLTTLLSLLGVIPVLPAQEPKIDKQKFAQYVRYAEGFAPGVQIQVDDPAPSPFKGYYRVLVHLSAGAQKLDHLYYVTADGQHFIAGNIWKLGSSPFLDTLDYLPKDGPSFGPADAKVTIYVFSDFECPYCRELAKTIRDNIPQKYPTDVRVIFEDFPIDSIHKWARAASEAAHCLAQQKPEAFWAFHDWIFAHQEEVDQTNLSEKVDDFAKEQNLDPAKLNSCVASHATAQGVSQSLKAGQELGISRTPTIFVNGRMVPGAVPWETLDTVIKLELNRPPDIAGASTAPCCEVQIPTAVKTTQ